MGAATNHIVDWSAIQRCRYDYEIVRVHFEHSQIMEQFGGQRVHKALMHVAGVPCGPNRLPLSTLTGSQLEALERALDDAGLMPFIRPG